MVSMLTKGLLGFMQDLTRLRIYYSLGIPVVFSVNSHKALDPLPGFPKEAIAALLFEKVLSSPVMPRFHTYGAMCPDLILYQNVETTPERPAAWTRRPIVGRDLRTLIKGGSAFRARGGDHASTLYGA